MQVQVQVQVTVVTTTEQQVQVQGQVQVPLQHGSGVPYNVLNDNIHMHPRITAHIYSSVPALPNASSLAPVHPGTAAKLNPRCGNLGYGQKWS